MKRGIYTISEKPDFKPEVSEDFLKLVKIISKTFDEVKYCIWETDRMNQFTNHLSSKKMIIFEKDFVETLYYELKDKTDLDIFLNPDEEEFEYYISESSKPVIIKN